jgi:hypothetical protein
MQVPFAAEHSFREEAVLMFAKRNALDRTTWEFMGLGWWLWHILMFVGLAGLVMMVKHRLHPDSCCEE